MRKGLSKLRKMGEEEGYSHRGRKDMACAVLQVRKVF